MMNPGYKDVSKSGIKVFQKFATTNGIYLDILNGPSALKNKKQKQKTIKNPDIQNSLNTVKH